MFLDWLSNPLCMWTWKARINMLFQLAFLQIKVRRTAKNSFSAPSYPKYSPNTFTFSQTKKQKEWVASRECNTVLWKLMLSGSRVQRPGRPNLLAIWNIIQKFYFHLMGKKHDALKGRLWEKSWGDTKDWISLNVLWNCVVWEFNLIYMILLLPWFLILEHATTC